MAADDQGRGHPSGGTVGPHGQAGQVFGVVAQLDALAAQGWVDLVAVAGQADGGGLCDHPGGRPAERLGEQDRVGGAGWPAGLPPLARRLAGLGVDALVADLLGPGGEAVVELVQRGGPCLLGLDQEPLADEPVEPLLLASALGLTG